MRTPSKQCFLIGSHIANRSPESFDNDTYTVDCTKCGVYMVTREALANHIPSNRGHAPTMFAKPATQMATVQ